MTETGEMAIRHAANPHASHVMAVPTMPIEPYNGIGRIDKPTLVPRSELERVERELADMKSTFDLRWNADQRAIKAWQAAHPGSEQVWPDHADMVVWLMGKTMSVQEFAKYQVERRSDGPTGPTPRTDDEFNKSCGSGHYGPSVPIDFARQLERELEISREETRMFEGLAEKIQATLETTQRQLTATREHLESARGQVDTLNRSLENVGAQLDKLAEACRALLDSEEVQNAWPMDGTKRAEKPKDTHSSATATVKFRRLLAIHAIIAAVKGGAE